MVAFNDAEEIWHNASLQSGY